MSELVGFQHGGYLRVSHVWRDEVMADRVLMIPAPVVLGNQPGVTFVVPELGLPPGFAMIRPGARGYLLTLGSNMTGKMRLGGDEVDVADFVRKADREGSHGSFRGTGIAPGDWGVVHLDGHGEHSLFFQFVKADQPIPKPGWRDSQLLLPGWALSVLLHTALLVYIFTIGRGGGGLVFPGKREVVAGYLVTRPPPVLPEPPPAPEPAPGLPDSVEKEPPSSTQGEEGKAGGEGDKERLRAPDPDKGEPDKPLPKSIRVGLLSETSRETIRKAADRGGFDQKLGQAIARLQGPANGGSMAGFGQGKGTGVGLGEGTGTLTRSSGHGAGGGGNNIGDVQTSEAIKTGGNRPGHGLPGGTGVKEVAVKVQLDAPSGDLGGLTRDEILKVLSSRKNGFRTCYERELQRNKGLGGKVVVSWKINASGVVLDPRVSKSTMNSGSVEDCIVRQISSLHFPSPRNGAVAKVNFPFLFAPR